LKKSERFAKTVVIALFTFQSGSNPRKSFRSVLTRKDEPSPNFAEIIGENVPVTTLLNSS
jgi:hypothetical protein